MIEEGITNLKHIYPFYKFNRQVSDLDRLLTKAGLFVIQHTQYRFEEATAAGKYLSLRGLNQEVSLKFDRDSEKLTHNDSVARQFL